MHPKILLASKMHFVKKYFFFKVTKIRKMHLKLKLLQKLIILNIFLWEHRFENEQIEFNNVNPINSFVDVVLQSSSTFEISSIWILEGLWSKKVVCSMFFGGIYDNLRNGKYLRILKNFNI